MLGGHLAGQMPALSLLLDDLGAVRAPWLAKVFKVSRSTAYRWVAQDRAPVAVTLALWLSAPSYGHRRAWNAVIEAENGQATHAAYALSLRSEVHRLRRELARVLAAGDFGSANAPSWQDTAAELLAGSATKLDQAADQALKEALRRPTDASSRRERLAVGR